MPKEYNKLIGAPNNHFVTGRIEAMEYQEFIILWLEALGQARFPSLHLLRPSEAIDINSLDRIYRCYLWWPETPENEIFHVTAEIL
jgi:hypothetical protein